MVEREWRNERREEAGEAFYRGLRERYVISIEGSAEDNDDGGPAVAAASP